jgi:hypothetical protein
MKKRTMRSPEEMDTRALKETQYVTATLAEVNEYIRNAEGVADIFKGMLDGTESLPPKISRADFFKPYGKCMTYIGKIKQELAQRIRNKEVNRQNAKLIKYQLASLEKIIESFSLERVEEYFAVTDVRNKDGKVISTDPGLWTNRSRGLTSYIDKEGVRVPTGMGGPKEEGRIS